MKKIILALVAVFFTLSSAAFAAEPCPPNMSCSEHDMMPIPQSGKPAATAKEEKKRPTAEEQAAYMKQVEEARIRDHDLIITFSDKSLTESCYAPTDKFYRWLIENKDVVVDKKELSISHYIWSKNNTGCTTMMIVHYHKK